MSEVLPQYIKPVSPAYRTMEPYDAFTWSDGIKELDEGGITLVAFTALFKLNAPADKVAKLHEHDYASAEEAKTARGYITYFPDEVSEDNRALSFCLWKTPEDSRSAMYLPKHQAALQYARKEGHNLYEDYTVRKFLIEQVTRGRKLGAKVLQFSEFQQDGSLIVVGETEQKAA